MAGKKTALTSEEKLAQALVPQDQQPYKLPKGWVWTYLLDGFAKCCDSSRKPVSASERATLKGDIPYYGATGQVGWINDYLTNEELVLIGEDGAPFLDVLKDKAYIINGKAWINNHAHILKSYFGHIGNLYLVHYLNSFDYRGFVNGTTRLKLTQGNMKKIPIPLPPLPEQQRIVSRIESLFTKLDAARDKLQQVLDTQEARRAAILHEAFSGGWGTGDSEEGRGKSEEGDGLAEGTVSVPEGWKVVRLSDVCTVNPKKLNVKDKDDKLKVSFFPMASLNEELGEITKPEIKDLVDVKKGFTNFQEGDVVFAKITPCMENGKSAVIGPLVNQIGYGTTEFFVLRCHDDLYNRFLFHLVRSIKFRSEAKAQMTGAVGQQRVPKHFLEQYEFLLPPMEEQVRIVEIIDNLYEKEYKMKNAAQSAFAQIDLLKKAILARAFRGELGTGDPEDPDVLDLLKQCR